MIELPKSCLVNKFIPKKTFYERAQISSNAKDEFVNIIDKIIWLYKIAEDTIKINKTDKVEEIQIFEIDLKEKKLPKNAIRVISRAIQYPILFILKFEDDYCYSIRVEDIYYTEWNENIQFDFNGINLEYIYEQIVKSIIHENNNNSKLDEVIQQNTEKAELEKKILELERKIKQEKQFNRKVELNQELRKLKNEMGKN